MTWRFCRFSFFSVVFVFFDFPSAADSSDDRLDFFLGGAES
jgi:hypothetical protein